MARAGLLTYILLQMWQHLAFSAVRALWVCLCRDRLELDAKCLPHSSHSYFDFDWLVFLKLLMSISGSEMSEAKEVENEGEERGEKVEVEEGDINRVFWGKSDCEILR